MQNEPLATALRILPIDGSHPNHVRVAAAHEREALIRIADAIGISRAHMYNIAKGRSVPSLAVAQKLARHFGVKVEDLFPALLKTYGHNGHNGHR